MAKFLLKDQLFNKQSVTTVAQEIAAVYSQFQVQQFISTVIDEFPQLELMARMYWVRQCLRTYLPADYRQAVKILLAALPPQLDPQLSDGDFGGYVHRAYGDFVAEYGATQQDVQFSLNALQEMTKCFSCEFPIRVFLNKFPQETLLAMQTWVKDEHYHVRRLVSEGTRPSLPWAKNIMLDYKIPLQFLAVLQADSTRFVTRSVANHLNDISKFDPNLVLQSLQKWQKTTTQKPAEFAFITRHALRTLLKQGNAKALKLLGYETPKVTANLQLNSKQVKIGQDLSFALQISSKSTHSQLLLVDYNLFFQKADGSLKPKTFKIAKLKLAAGETVNLQKIQSLAPMSTRRLYRGKHQVELQINGQRFEKQDFDLLQ